MIVKAEELTVAFGGVEVLSNVSFSAEKGEYICIAGRNGSGKSTLIKSLLGLVPKKSGSVTFAPEAGRIGYLPQQSGIEKNFPASVWETVLSGCLNSLGMRPFFSGSQKRKALENMRRLDILDIRDKPFSVLSGGQRQRVLLARALCAAENLLLLDEPVTGLDPIVTEELYHLIYQMNRERGFTVLMVSHDVETALKYAGKVLHLDHKIRFFGTTEEYLHTELGSHFTERCCRDHD